MSGVNKVIIVGRLGKDPEMKYLESGTAVANMSVATSEQWTDKNTGEKKEKTEWHRIVAFDKAAELCGKFLEKGSLAYFEGKLETRKWKDKDNIERYTTEIKLNPFGGIQFLQRAEGQTRQEQPAQQQQPTQAPANKKEDDDIPF